MLPQIRGGEQQATDAFVKGVLIMGYTKELLQLVAALPLLGPAHS